MELTDIDEKNIIIDLTSFLKGKSENEITMKHVKTHIKKLKKTKFKKYKELLEKKNKDTIKYIVLKAFDISNNKTDEESSDEESSDEEQSDEEQSDEEQSDEEQSNEEDSDEDQSEESSSDEEVEEIKPAKKKKTIKKKKEKEKKINIDEYREQYVELLTKYMSNEKVAQQFEKNIFKYVNEKSGVEDIDSYYQSKLIDLVRIISDSSIFIKNDELTTLITNVNNGDNMSQFKLINANSWELFPSSWDNVITEQNKKIEQMTGDEKVEGIYTCAKCGSTSISVHTSQNRGSDESETVFAKCGCGNSWTAQ